MPPSPPRARRASTSARTGPRPGCRRRRWTRSDRRASAGPSPLPRARRRGSAPSSPSGSAAPPPPAGRGGGGRRRGGGGGGGARAGAAHPRALHRDRLAVVRTGVAEQAALAVPLLRVLEVRLGDVLRPQWVAGQEAGLRVVTRLGADVDRHE